MLRITLWHKLALIIVLGWAAWAAAPNFIPGLHGKTINFGLDLQGGAHLGLQVDMADVLQRQYDNLADEVRKSLREERLNYRELTATQQGVSFDAFKPEQHDQIMQTLRKNLRDVTYNQQGDVYHIAYNDVYLTELQKRVLGQTLEVLRSRVDEFGVSEPVLQLQGADRVIVQLPGIEDTARAKAIIGRTAQLAFYLVDDSLSPYGELPEGKTVMYEQDERTGIKTPLVVNSRPAITGERLANASTGFDSRTGEAAVYVTFDGAGTRTFGKLTTENVGKRMAIALDGTIYSAPNLREPILGGTAQITGSFTPQTAEDLATVLRAGALPAKVDVVEERTVGPSLGADSVAAGKTAVIIGFIFVMLAMVLVYRQWGIAADLALLANVLLIMAIMSAVGFTLTLPGIAGILLTIGMAVDANVLIFERIREEAKNGRKPRAALDYGFQGAVSTIVDANVTTLIAAIVLFAMGSGPVKGFALTLTVGILSSMFTAILLTRALLVLYVNTAKPKALKI